MPAGKRLGLVQKDQDVNEAIKNIAEFHISAVRRTRAGAITSVKHIAMGWMTVAEYYNLQKVDDLIPFAVEFIKGGYMLKAALYTIAIPVDVIASGTSVPLGLAIVAAAITLYVIDTAAGNRGYAALDIAALLLPFGEIWLLYHGAGLFAQAIKGVDLAGSPLLIDYEAALAAWNNPNAANLITLAEDVVSPGWAILQGLQGLVSSI